VRRATDTLVNSCPGAEELTGSYGAVFTNRMLQVYHLTANTSLAISTDKLTIFASFVSEKEWD
jgi:hypothetical protein